MTVNSLTGRSWSENDERLAGARVGVNAARQGLSLSVSSSDYRFASGGTKIVRLFGQRPPPAIGDGYGQTDLIDRATIVCGT